jgi:ferredoxin-NADP reductase
MKLKLIDKKVEESDVTTFIFEPAKPIAWQAGQYIHYTLWHNNADDRGTDRFFTISSPPFSKNPSITTRFFGDKSSSFKKALFALPIGGQIEADKPDGRFVLNSKASQHVFIAGGIGITPFRSILKQLDNDKQVPKITLLYANNNKDVIFEKELDNIAKRNEQLTVRYFIGKHISNTDFEPFMGDSECVFYISGPEAMVKVYRVMLRKMGVKRRKIKTDYFPGY